MGHVLRVKKIIRNTILADAKKKWWRNLRIVKQLSTWVLSLNVMVWKWPGTLQTQKGNSLWLRGGVVGAQGMVKKGASTGILWRRSWGLDCCVEWEEGLLIPSMRNPPEKGMHLRSIDSTLSPIRSLPWRWASRAVGQASGHHQVTSQCTIGLACVWAMQA